MQTKSRIGATNAELLRLARLDEGRKRTKQRNKEAARKYMQTEHLFTLFIGKKNTGIKRTMLGRDAKLMNNLNVLKFGKGESKELMSWTPIEEIREKQLNHENVGYGVNVGNGVDKYKR